MTHETHTHHWHLIAYDIRDPKRYRKAYKTLRGYGTPVQYSIFRCRMTRRQLEKLRLELARDLTGEDSLMIIPLCDRCTDRIIEEGPEAHFDDDDDTFLIF